MKNFLRAFFLSVLITPLFLYSQDAEMDSTGLSGDHFSLEGALDAFSRSASIEEFEKSINSEDNQLNNLDLNMDGDVDYISVKDNSDGEAHAFVLQVMVNEKETQDIAVVELEKTGDEYAVAQIVGDEELYGEEMIIEAADETTNRGKGGPSATSETFAVVVNVWLWPSVRFVYGPLYRPWASPFRWGLYPHYWKPWRVRPWHTHWNGCRVYRGRYNVVFVHRTNHAHLHYRSARVTSVTVHNNCKKSHENYNARKSGMSNTKNTQKASGRQTDGPKKQKVQKSRSPQKSNSNSGQKSGVSKGKGRKGGKGGKK